MINTTIGIMRGYTGLVASGLRHASNRFWQYTVPSDADYAILRRLVFRVPKISGAPLNPVTPAVWLSMDGAAADSLIDILYSSPTTGRFSDDQFLLPLPPGAQIRGSVACWPSTAQQMSVLAYIDQIGGIAPGYLVQDLFTAASGTNLTAHVADSGQTWSIGAGTWMIQNNALQSAAAAGVEYATIGSGYGDVDVRANVTINQLIGGAVMARFTDINNYYAAALSGSGQLIIRTLIGGTDVETGVTTVGNITADSVGHELRLRCVGKYLSLFWDGALKGSVVAGSLLAPGRVGIWNSNNATAGFNPFNDFRVTAL